MRKSSGGRFRKRRARRPFAKRYAKLPAHRRPTLQLTLLHDAVPGLCRWCNEAVPEGRTGRKRTWHDGRNEEPDCVAKFREALPAWQHAWRIQTRPAYGKRIIADRDGAQCKSCRAKRGRGFKWLELDHVIPLADGGSPNEENLQLLCPDCHTCKTGREATARARARREAAAASPDNAVAA